MPFQYKSHVVPIAPTNKHEEEVNGNDKKEDCKLRWVYKYTYGGGKIAYVSPPKIDMLTMVVPVLEEERRESIIGFLMDAPKDVDSKTGYVEPEESEPKFKVFNAKKKLGYMVASVFQLDGIDSQVLVQAKQTSDPDAKSFVRISLNPNGLGKEGLNSFKTAMGYTTLGSLEWDDVIKDGKITRCDVAIDLFNTPTEFLTWSSHVEGKSQIHTDPDGNVQTVYMGKKKNSAQY